MEVEAKAIVLSPRLADQLEQALLVGGRHELLRELCLQRLPGAAGAGTWLSLHRAQKALKMAEAGESFAQACLQASGNAVALERLADYARASRDRPNLLRVRVEQWRSSPAERQVRHAQIAQLLSKRAGELDGTGQAVSDVLVQASFGDDADGYAQKARYLELIDRPDLARDTWRQCLLKSERRVESSPAAVLLAGLVRHGDAVSVYRWLTRLIPVAKVPLGPGVRSKWDALVAEMVVPLEHGRRVYSFTRMHALTASLGELAARSLRGASRFDLLAQLRLCQATWDPDDKRIRADLILAIKQLQDLHAIRALWSLAACLQGARHLLLQLLTRLRREEALDDIFCLSSQAYFSEGGAISSRLMSLARQARDAEFLIHFPAWCHDAHRTNSQRTQFVSRVAAVNPGAAVAALADWWSGAPDDGAEAVARVTIQVIKALPWGFGIQPLARLFRLKGPEGDRFARSLLRLERWDLLAQLRLGQLEGASAAAPARHRFSAALAHCRDAHSLDTVWEMAGQRSELAAEVIRALGQQGQFDQLDRLVGATGHSLPQDFAVALAWAKTFGQRGDAATESAMVRELATRESTLPDQLSALASFLKQAGRWDALDWVRIRQFQEGKPLQRERISSHLRGVRAAQGEEGVRRFLARLAGVQTSAEEARAYVVRLLVQQNCPELIHLVSQTRLDQHPSDLAARLLLIEYWFVAHHHTDRPSNLRAHVDLARQQLSQLPRVSSEAAGGITELTVYREDHGSRLGPLLKMRHGILSPSWAPLIEALASATHHRGTFEIWQGYEPDDIKGADRHRRPNEIRVARRSGEFLAWLVESLRPAECIEVGSGFGTSGMYISSAMETLSHGRLRSFEPNPVWARIARENVALISSRASVCNSTFENASDQVQSGTIDFAFIDAIHTPDAVAAQLQIMRTLASPGAVLVIDDVNFSPEMYAYWNSLAHSSEFIASAEFAGRFGVLEIASSN